jgi:hypothetical protein
MFLSFLLFRVLPALLDLPWTNAPSRKPLVARRILVFRMIVLPILVSFQTRESVVVARRILVISPQSSLHWYEVVQVFARARMCGHRPLVSSAYAKKHVKLTSAFLMNRHVSFSP